MNTILKSQMWLHFVRHQSHVFCISLIRLSETRPNKEAYWFVSQSYVPWNVIGLCHVTQGLMHH